MMSDNQIDKQLIAEVQAGNKQAFDALVIKYQHKMFKVVARYVSDPTEVLDVTQETFIKAYRAIHSFRADSSFFTWLYRIGVNTAKNYVMSQGRKLPEVDYEITEIEQYISKANVKEYSTPEKGLIYDEMESMLHGLIAQLPPELKTTLMLREVEGLTYDEIAALMDCPVGTVRSRIYRAREVIEKKSDSKLI